MTVAITFHGIGDPIAPVLPAERPFWLTLPRFCAVLDRIVHRGMARSVCITIDDGLISDHSHALPELVRRGLRARIFVTTDRIGVPGYVDAAHLRDLAAAGFVIGSHGHSHRPWTQLDLAALDRDMATARARLEDLLARPVAEAAVPFGLYNRHVLRALRRTGHTAVWTSDGGRHDPAAFLRPRTTIRSDTTEQALDRILDGQIPPLARMRRALGMLRKRL